MASSVEVRGVSKQFRLFQEKYTSLKEKAIHFGKIPFEVFPALSDISFEVEQGTTLGLLGHNGSGKSTLLKCIAGILTPTSGEILVRGRVAAMLELGAGFHPDLSGRDNIYLNASLLGLSRREVDRCFDDIVDFSELGPFIENQVKFYSSGMYARLGFAVAVNMDPDVLLVDEVLAVGDANFQLKCINKIKSFQKEGRTIVFVSHSPELVRGICDTAFVLDHGRLVGGGPTPEAITVLQQFQLAGSSLLFDPAREQERAIPAAGGEVQLSRLEVNGVVVDQRAVAVDPGSQAEMAIEVESPPAQAIFAHFELVIINSENIPVFAFNTRDMGVDAFLLRGTTELSARFDSFVVGSGAYSVRVSLYSEQSGMLIEVRQWDNALVVAGGRRGVSGVVAMDVSIFAEELSNRRL